MYNMRMIAWLLGVTIHFLQNDAIYINLPDYRMLFKKSCIYAVHIAHNTGQ